MNRRKFITAVSLAGVGTTALFPPNTSAQTTAKVYEYTFLKSLDSKPDNLIKFIIANWFAMDKIAVEKGLMVNYTVFEAPSETEPWNIVVAVGYPTEKGYEAIVEEFEKIRQKHQRVLIDGKGLRELGTIVGSRKFFPRGGSQSE